MKSIGGAKKRPRTDDASKVSSHGNKLSKKSRELPPNASLQQCKSEIDDLFGAKDAHHQPCMPVVEDVSEAEMNAFIKTRTARSSKTHLSEQR